MKKILSLVVVFFLLTSISWGDMGHSQEGYNAEVTLTHTSALDSAWVIFTYNSSRYDSIKTTSLFGGSRFLQAFGLDLDSVGMHSVDIRMYTGDAWSDTLTGGWLHENPNLVSSDNIGINLNDVTGTLDAGEIGADAITAAKIATDAITSDEIATSAIGNLELAAGCIGGSEMATDAIGATEISIAAAQKIAAEVWTDVDTSATIDTSALGAWLIANTKGGAADVAAIKDTVNAILDTLQLHDDWVAQEAGEIADILDTLQNQDDWVAKEATVAEVPDILDTLQSQDDWVAQQAEILNIDAWNPITDNDSLIVDLTTLSGIGGATKAQVADTMKWVVWQNQDTTWVDSSVLGVWLMNNLRDTPPDTGSACCTLCVKSTEMEDGIDLTIRDITEGNIIATRETGSGGCTITNLTPQDIIVYITETDGIVLSQTQDTFTVAAGGLNDTVYVSKTTHSTSSSPKCTIFGYFKDIFGIDTVETGWQNYKITFTPVQAKMGQVYINTSGDIIVPQPKTISANDTAYFSVDIYRTASVKLYRSSADTTTAIDSLKYNIRGYTQAFDIFEINNVLVKDTSQYKISDLILQR